MEMEAKKKKAAGVGTVAALKNVQLDYKPLANLVQANVNGQRMASSFLEDLHSHYADPDTLYLAVKNILPESKDIEALTTLRGFMRVLQKRIERSAP
jgi:hypothetical protein